MKAKRTKKPNNAEILSAGSKIYAKKRKVKKETVENVDFDFDARKDFLTGFHKRKVERKKKTIEKYKELARQEKIKARAEAKAERQRLADKNVADVAAILRGGLGDEEEEFEGFPEEEEEEERIEEKKEPDVKEFKSKSALTTVTVIEDLDLDEQ
ncbi:hypothetical protein DFQ28_002295 [Apophysomyces sp. BC1034]|nr:hypothetical protein DFQ30_003555 [Apophysomyces sp. BC1015]KAG0179000.1 hypothetical protein DFQ29_002742 [Apophysomyces sp. BC1021]KAG0190258.1 hypothetical protein DFQ28_002295 [Apophysomyces sp. BC1034]